MRTIIPVMLLIIAMPITIACQSSTAPSATPAPQTSAPVITQPDNTPTSPAATTTAQTTKTTQPASEPTPAPSATPASGSIIQPTPTPTPTPTPAPIPTVAPRPTPQTRNTADDPDICRRTPWVQDAILDLLHPVELCAAVSPRELFRILKISLRDIENPGDLQGFENLREFYYSGPVNNLDFSHTRKLRFLTLADTPEWPGGWSFAALPRLKSLRIGYNSSLRGKSACQLFDRAILDQVFGPLKNRWHEIDLEIRLTIPQSITPDPGIARTSLAEALGLNPRAMAAAYAAASYGDDWQNYLPHEQEQMLAQFEDQALQNVIQLNIDANPDASCQPYPY